MATGPYKAGSGLFGNDSFVVEARDGTWVQARYLVDSNGYYVMDPNTSEPLIIPADFDAGEIQARYSQYSENAANDAATTGADPRTILYGDFFANFSQGGQDELQRSYDGQVGQGPFVPVFTDAASFSRFTNAQTQS